MWRGVPSITCSAARLRRGGCSFGNPARGHLLLISHAMLEIEAIARRNAEQVRRTPHDIVLELADLAVGVDHLPHHLDDAEPALLVDRTHDDAGETIEIDGVALGTRRR